MGELEIELIKSVASIADTNGNGVTGIGDIVTFSFLVTNTGNVPLTNVTLSDTIATVTGGPIPLLSVGGSDATTFSATYEITAADILAGGIENVATTTGEDPTGAPVTDVSDTGTAPDGTDVADPGSTETPNPLAVNPNDVGDPTEDPTTVLLVPNPDISIIKSVASVTDDGDGVVGAGDTIVYSFLVTNTGNVPLTDVTVTDDTATVAGGPIALAIGDSDATTFTATYVITDADVANEGVENTATVEGEAPDGTPVTDVSDTGTDPGGTPVPDPEGTETPNPLDVNPNDPTDPGDDPTTFTLVPNPGVLLIKTVDSVTDTNGDGLINAGDVINYVYEIINAGNVPLTNVTVTDGDVDSLLGLPIPVLPIGGTDTTTFTATRAITAADMLAGGVEGSALVTGTAPSGAPTTDISDAGSAPDLAAVANPANEETPNPLGVNPNDPAAPGDDPVTVLVNTSPEIEVIKSIDSVTDNGDRVLGAGDTINFVFAVTNIGDVDLTDVVLVDPLATVSGGPVPSLAVGDTDSTTFTATYVITDADVAAGGVENVAVATGTDSVTGETVDDTSDTGTAPDGSNVPDPGGTETPNELGSNPNDPDDPADDPTTLLIPEADLSVEKSVDDKAPARGDTVTYTVVIANAGPATAVDVTLADELPDGLTVSALPDLAGWTCTASEGDTKIDCAGPDIAAGDSVELTYEVDVSGSAARGRALVNTVVVDSPTPDRNPDNNTDTERVQVPNPPSQPPATPLKPAPHVPFKQPKPKPEPKKTLAFTGSSAQILIASAAVLVMTGGSLMIVGRRRRDEDGEI